MRTGLIPLCLLPVAAAVAANGVEDGNAGLAALNRGDFDGAIRLFTRALKAPDLTGDDREFAYLSRGRAYLGKKAWALAAADFRQAKKLKADDAAAADGLRLALAHGNGAALPAKPPTEAQLRARWGVMDQLPGKTWLLSGRKPEEYIRYRWQTPGQVLAYEALDRRGRAITGQCTIPASGQAIECQDSADGVTAASTILLADGAYQETVQTQNSAIRATYTLNGPDRFGMTGEALRGGQWVAVPAASMELVAVGEDRIAALNWHPHKQSAFGKFLGAIGRGVAEGIAGDGSDPSAQAPQ